MDLNEVNEEIPTIVQNVNEVLCLDDPNHVIAILRESKWNVNEVKEKWFD